ncbi:MAG: COR domain-containing protein [Candidatus Electrothrix sp. GW3-4]|uniref:COR domain-containing protein n=1 Tax=Candidatus Electrothrix sp. GW3-4 TaxID=3126740 RepID=UPI0030CB8EAA
MTNERVLQKIEEAKASGTTTLRLSGQGLKELPSEIGQLTNLTELDLCNNQFSSLPPEIRKLTNLQKLRLWNNKLTTLPPEISQLTNLTVLDLRNNQLRNLPSGILKLTKLKELDLYSNYIDNPPSEIGQLKQLTGLNLGHNHLRSLPPEIYQLTTLTVLDLRHNQFSNLPPKIGQLTNLTELNLSNNRLNVLPLEICKLTSLKKLFLLDNELTTLPPEICQLTKLMVLNLSNNHLSSLPREICKLKNLKELYFGRNPLTSPPYEIATRGIDAICQYFAAFKPNTSIGVVSDPVLLPSKDQSLSEVKVLVVGDGAAGKTSLVKRLLGLSFDHHEDTTHGININGWQQDIGDRKIRINIWDFGGQVIQHTTHQFFLSKRSLYILVLDGRKEERPEYWLQHIESFGGDSPVLVVLNKQDESCGFGLNCVHLQRKYPTITGFYPTSCKNNVGIEEFRVALLKELRQMPLLDTPWPKSWFAVKQRIGQMGKPYISCEEYETICKKAGISEEKNQKTLLSFLHDLGAAIHFDDYILNAMHVLDPVWITQAVYKIITAKEMADSNGLLQLESLKKILQHEEEEKHSWPIHTHVFILELMKKFQLCWGVGEEAVLLPQFFPIDEPEFTFDYSGSLGFILQYQDFLPPSVFSRFMVKVHQNIKSGLCWRTGVVLEDKASGTNAVVKADHEARRIYLWVHGPRRKEYLSFLWFTLREINNSFEKLEVSERIPMPDDPQRSADYETLINFAEAGADIFIPDGSKKRYSVKELLGLVEPSKEDEILRTMQKLQAELEHKEAATEASNINLELKPNAFGVGINLNSLFEGIKSKVRARVLDDPQKGDKHE